MYCTVGFINFDKNFENWNGSLVLDLLKISKNGISVYFEELSKIVLCRKKVALKKYVGFKKSVIYAD
jgi:hypothetical protein